MVNLLSLIESDLGPGEKTGNNVRFLCPFRKEKHPSLLVSNTKKIWKCFGCGKVGDAITWLREYRGMTFQEAYKAVNGGDLPSGRGYNRPQAPEAGYLASDNPPGEAWKRRALEIISKAQEALWSEKGANTPLDWPENDPETGKEKINHLSPLDWLLNRGLTENTLKTWQIGFIPFDWQDQPKAWGLNCSTVNIKKGILIPCIVGSNVWYLKIRQPKAKPHKYTQITGGKTALYMADNLAGQEAAVLCEGEFDALLLWQEIKYLAGVATMGSATAKLNVSTWGFYLLGTSPDQRFTAYDLDEAGSKGSSGLEWMHTRPLAVPRLRPHDKDISDFYHSGGDLLEWFKSETAR